MIFWKQEKIATSHNLIVKLESCEAVCPLWRVELHARAESERGKFVMLFRLVMPEQRARQLFGMARLCGIWLERKFCVEERWNNRQAVNLPR